MASFPAYAAHFPTDLDLHVSMSSPSWNSLDDEYNYGNHYEPLLTHRLAIGHVALQDLSSMQRYIGADDSPFTANPFHSTLRKLEMGGVLRPNNMTIQNDFRRGGSPADTTSSANSHWTTHHSDYASEQLGRPSISSQSAYSPSMMSCDGYEVSQSQHTHFVSGGGCGISLNTIQPFDPDNAQDELEECPVVELSPLQHSYDPGFGQYSSKVERYDSHQECEGSDEKLSAPECEDSDSVEAGPEDEGSDTDYKPNRRSSLVSKRPRRRSSQSSNSSSGRSNKRNSSGRKASLSSPTSNRVEKSRAKSGRSASNGHFPCVFAGYGCASVFNSKNEWKRHVSTQHIKLVFWRCDLCAVNTDPKNPVYNDFNRKDLFTQHLRRMHANIDGNGHINGVNPSKKGVCLTNAIPEDVIAEHQQRCCQELRQMPPRSSCLFCARSFVGKDSWQERMDHIGTHLEKDRKSCDKANVADVSTWQVDEKLEEWLLEEGLIVNNSKRGWALGDGTPLRIKQETQ